MRDALDGLFVLRGLAHGAGFAVPWKMRQSEERAHTTTLLANRLDV